MINVNELRIGNWISSTKGIGYDRPGLVQVLSIGLSGINQWQDMGASGQGYLEDIYGIPLTPEILEQCGFEKKSGLDNKNGISPDYFEYEGLKLWDNNDEQTSWYHVNSELLIYIDYLHQLQNLYFALTGEELQVNIHEKEKL